MTWTAPSFLDEFATRLEERNGLASVKVYTSTVEQIEAEESIVFVRVEGDQNWSAIGHQPREDKYTVQSSILIARTGAGQEVAKAARDRAKEILSEVEADVIELMRGNTATFAEAIGANQITGMNIARITLSQGANQNGERWTQVDFDLEVTARI